MTVEVQDPGPRQEVDRGETVVITYPDTIALPQLVGKGWQEACRQLEDVYLMRCDSQQGSPSAGQCTKPGTVYAQSPQANEIARVGTRVTVTVCPGDLPVGDYRNLVHNPNDPAQQTACSAIAQHGFQCNAVQGTTPVGTGAQPFTTYGQDPAPGTVVPAGSTVTVYYYSNNGPATPDYRGQSFDAVCADLQAKGYVCNPVRQLYPDVNVATNVVFAQDPAPGAEYPLGTTINVYYQELQPVEWWIYHHDTVDAYKMAPAGAQLPNYSRQAYRVGLGYPAGAQLSIGSEFINQVHCTNQTPDNCNGRTPNVFYSHVTEYQGWTVTPHATFMKCTGAPGQIPMYRVWKGPANDRHYALNANPNPPEYAGPHSGSELLGCVWQ